MKALIGITSFVTGIITASAFFFITQLNESFTQIDPTYHVVATEHFYGVKNTGSVYQAKVFANYDKENSKYIVKAIICINSGDYYHNVGLLGNAKSLVEAKEKFGKIYINEQAVSFVSLDQHITQRVELEKHR